MVISREFRTEIGKVQEISFKELQSTIQAAPRTWRRRLWPPEELRTPKIQLSHRKVLILLGNENRKDFADLGCTRDKARNALLLAINRIRSRAAPGAVISL
jgi:hypothetical protein